VKLSLNILILGTSNSLLKGGWVDGLRTATPNCTIKNLSIGASPGIQFASLLHTDFSEYDYVFFDSVPNDEEYQYLTRGYSEVEFSTKILYEIFSTISAQSRLVVLGICNKRYLNKESQIYSLRRSLAAKCGAEFVDVRQLLVAYSGFFVRRSGVRDIYDDHPSHPLPQHMFFIGDMIGRCLLQLPVEGEAIGKCYRDRYAVWHASSVVDTDLKVVERSNSLLRESFVLLVENESLEFGESGKCIGFYVNYRGTNAAISVLGKNSEEVFHINLFGGVDDRVMKVFVPMPNGKIISKILVREKCGDESYTPMMFKKTRGDQCATELQISHAVFIKPNQDDEFDASSICSSTQASPSRLMNMVFGMVELAVKAEEEKRRKPGMIDYFGRYIYFDVISNKCIAVDPERNVGPADDLYSVVVKDEGDRVNLYARIGNGLFLLTAYTDRVSISSSVVLSIAKLPQDKVGDLFVVSSKKENYFSISCGEIFLSALPSGDIVCNRVEAKNWELFSFVR
jgi:hypothetical protein